MQNTQAQLHVIADVLIHDNITSYPIQKHANTTNNTLPRMYKAWVCVIMEGYMYDIHTAIECE